MILIGISQYGLLNHSNQNDRTLRRLTQPLLQYHIQRRQYSMLASSKQFQSYYFLDKHSSCYYTIDSIV
jgi:hypothetical protein